MMMPTRRKHSFWQYYPGTLLRPRTTLAAQRIKTGPAILVGEVAFVVYQGVFLIFNR